MIKTFAYELSRWISEVQENRNFDVNSRFCAEVPIAIEDDQIKQMDLLMRDVAHNSNFKNLL